MNHFADNSPQAAENQALTTLQQLERDNPRITEGLAMSTWFIRMLETAASRQAGLDRLPCTTLLLNNRALAWTHAAHPRHGDYIARLSREFRVHRIEHDADKGFMVEDSYRGGRPYMKPLPKLIENLYSENPQLRDNVYVPVSGDEPRRNEVFWGYLHAAYGDRIWSEIGLGRHLINDVIGKFHQFVVDVDFVLASGDDLWVVEFKHKTPMKARQPLSVGINRHEIQRLLSLRRCGFKIMHVLMMKPYRDKEVGSMRILTDRTTYNNTSILALELDEECLEDLLRRETVNAEGTALNGESMPTHPIEVDSFQFIGTLDDRLLPDLLTRCFREGTVRNGSAEQVERLRLP